MLKSLRNFCGWAMTPYVPSFATQQIAELEKSKRSLQEANRFHIDQYDQQAKVILELSAQLIQRNDELIERNNQMIARNAELSTARAEIEASHYLEILCDEREDKITLLTNKLETYKAALERRNADCAEHATLSENQRDTVISLGAEMGTARGEIQDLKATIANRDTVILFQKDKEVRQSALIATLEGTVREMRKGVKSMQTQLRDQEAAFRPIEEERGLLRRLVDAHGLATDRANGDPGQPYTGRSLEKGGERLLAMQFQQHELREMVGDMRWVIGAALKKLRGPISVPEIINLLEAGLVPRATRIAVNFTVPEDVGDTDIDPANPVLPTPISAAGKEAQALTMAEQQAMSPSENAA